MNREDRRKLDQLTRFQIETVLAYEYVGRNKQAAATLLHISYYCVNQDLQFVKAKTGLNPHKPDEMDRLVEMILNRRKECFGGRYAQPYERHFG